MGFGKSAQKLIVKDAVLETLVYTEEIGTKSPFISQTAVDIL
jgi:hypothetical protein